MATIFLSYSWADEQLARNIELRLRNSGHSFRISVGTPPIGRWRQALTNALRAADVLISLLSEKGLQSNFVASEIGSARILDETRGMLLLPIIVGTPFQVPSFVADYHCFRLPKDANKTIDDPDELDRLASEIHRAIDEHLYAVPKTPSIFVSHRHRDEALARALVNLIEVAFEIDKTDIRCTSVQPYTLSPGDRTSEKLRTEIRAAKVVLGLLSPDTKESKYVLAELGASWGCEVPTFPLLIRGATYEDVPEPLGERSCLTLGKETNCIQLVEEIARVTSLSRRNGAMPRIQEEASKLARICSGEN